MRGTLLQEKTNAFRMKHHSPQGSLLFTATPPNPHILYPQTLEPLGLDCSKLPAHSSDKQEEWGSLMVSLHRGLKQPRVPVLCLRQGSQTPAIKPPLSTQARPNSSQAVILNTLGASWTYLGGCFKPAWCWLNRISFCQERAGWTVGAVTS